MHDRGEDLVAGRFRVEGEIARGGMGVVLQATDVEVGLPVALKLARPELAQFSDVVKRFEREVEILLMLDHPSVVRLYGHGVLDDGTFYMALELLKGETLKDRLARVGPMEPRELAPIVRGLCEGLEHVHARGIVHRDLKPGNVFLPISRSQAQSVKLVDFGISLGSRCARLTITGEVLGTPRYMAPEQLSGTIDLDGRTDVYGVGLVLYEALTGIRAFRTSDPSELVTNVLFGRVARVSELKPELGAAVEAVVMRAIAPRREDRYASAVGLADAFEAAAAASRRPVRSFAVSADETLPPTVFVGSPFVVEQPSSPDAALEAIPETRVGPLPALPPRRAEASSSVAPVVRSSPPPPRRRRTGLLAVALAGIGTLALAAVVAMGLVASEIFDAIQDENQKELVAGAPAMDPPPRSFEVTSEPSGARVVRHEDGKVLCTTPCSMRAPASGAADIALDVALDGYAISSVRVGAGSPRAHVVLTGEVPQ